LESLIDKKITFPVGRVDFLPVRPCSFEEYLGAVGEQKSLGLINNLSVPDFAHDKVKSLFNDYTIVGCLPEILNNYAENRDLLVLLDTGLVNYSAGLQKVLLTSNIIDDIYQGRIAEQITAQELLTHNLSVRAKLCFWTREERNAQAEIDFVLPIRDMLIPINVKSGASGKLRSLHQFIKIAPHDIAVRIYSGKLNIEDSKTVEGKKFKLINLPFYLVGQIEQVLESFIQKNLI